MAETQILSNSWRRVNFAAASAALSSFARLDFPAGPGPGCVQALRVAAWCDASSGSAVLRVAFVDKPSGETVWDDTAAIALASPARRQDAAGTGGYYRCTVVFASTTSDKLDTLGAVRGDCEIYLGCTSLTTIASLDLYVQGTTEL